jgi:hypothetical protein
MRNVKFNAIKRQDGLVVGIEKEQLEGFFHEWGTMELKNEEGRIIGHQSCAIVEEEETQSIYRVLPEDVFFYDSFPSKLI